MESEKIDTLFFVTVEVLAIQAFDRLRAKDTAHLWRLDGLEISLLYNKDLETGHYDIYPRFRLCNGIVATYGCMIDKNCRINASLDREYFNAVSINKFLEIMQEGINNSSIQLYPELNQYDLTFMGKRYSVSANVNENGCYIDITTYRAEDSDAFDKNIIIRPIGLSKLIYRSLDCAITINGKETLTSSFALYEIDNMRIHSRGANKMANKILTGEVTLEEMKDKFLIQRDVLSDHMKGFERLRVDCELNHGIRKCEIGDVWEAKPWGLDGLYLYMNYDERSKIGWYDMQCRFRLWHDVVVRLVSTESRIMPYINLHTEVIEANSKKEFLRVMQESIDSSQIMILQPYMYKLTFRDMTYLVSTNMNEINFYAHFCVIRPSLEMMIMFIEPIELSENDPTGDLICKITLGEERLGYGILKGD